MFVRGETQSKAVNEMASAENPDEIDISEDEEDNEEAGEVGKETATKKVSNVEEMDVPDAVFGGLKKSGDE